jgi:type II secretory ATPase GspE/PulE/Tfp pilus assembly ATPase PilB-like protein
LLGSSLIGALAQRLARKLCKSCRKARIATADECRILDVDAQNPPEIYDGVGCDKCKNKGYKGRTAIVEILRVDREMEELIATNATRRIIMEHATKHGFVNMQQDGIAKVLNGEITITELVNTIDLTDRL